MRPGRRIILVATVASLVYFPTTLRVKGSVTVPANRIVFLAKFCFDFALNETSGLPRLKEAASNASGEDINDDCGNRCPGQWDLAFLSATPANKARIQLILFDDEAQSYPHEEDAAGLFHCGGEKLQSASKFQGDLDAAVLPNLGKFFIPLYEHLRPRWWYVSLVDCSGEDHVVEYDLHMTNPRQGFQREMSMEQTGVRQLIIFFSIYGVLTYTQLYAILMQSSARTKAPLRILLTIAIAAASWSLFLSLGDALWLLWSGSRLNPLYMGARSCKSWSKFILMGILMLLSKGKGISEELTVRDVLWVSVYFAPFFLACLVLELWGEYSQSRLYTTGFVYATWVGGILVIVDLSLAAFYVMNLKISYAVELEDARRVFYRKWGPLYTLAFLVLPVTVFLSTLLSPCYRTSVMMAITNGAHAAVLASLIVGLWPERTQAHFCVDSETLAKTFGREIELLDGEPGDHLPLQAHISNNGGHLESLS